MIHRLLRTVVPVARMLRRPAHGGALPPYRADPDGQLVILSPGRLIDDPDEASEEALGMTADARRMRDQRK